MWIESISVWPKTLLYSMGCECKPILEYIHMDLYRLFRIYMLIFKLNLYYLYLKRLCQIQYNQLTNVTYRLYIKKKIIRKIIKLIENFLYKNNKPFRYGI